MAFSCGHHTQEQTKWTLKHNSALILACPARGKTGEKNSTIHSRKPEGYKCTLCGKTFSAQVGTPFYRLHHSADLVAIVMTLIAFGCPVQAIVAAYGLAAAIWRTLSASSHSSGSAAQGLDPRTTG